MMKVKIRSLSVLVLIFLRMLSPTRCDMVDLFRASCPYTDFCTMDRLLEAPRNGSIPCCLDCFCDKVCHVFGDCCPDIYTSVPQDEAPRNENCFSSVAPTVYNDFSWISMPNSYRMVSTCPSDYTDKDGTVGKCEEEVYTANRSYDDMVIVSDPNNVIYRNNYCAMCHGVTDVIRWQLKVIKCRDNLESVRLEASKIKAYFMENCILASERPDSLTLNSRLIPCQRGIEGGCSNVRSNVTTNDTIALCEKGPYMPYSAYPMFIYYNAFCYECNRRQDQSTPAICEDNWYILTRSTTGTMSALLDVDENFSKTTPNNACGGSKKLDYYTNQCVTLYCPPFEAVSYGTCRPIATPVSMTVMIRSVFWTTSNVTVSRNISLYNTSIALHYRRKLREGFNDLDCPDISIVVMIYREITTNELLYLQVETTVELDKRKCTIRGIGNIIRNRPHLTESWLIHDKMITMKGHYSFFRHGEEWDLFLGLNIILHDVSDGSKKYKIEEFLVCPYFEIDLEMYNTFLTKVKGIDEVTNLTSLSVKTETMKGVYALSKSKLAVCVDQYLDESNGASQIKLSLQYASQEGFLYSVVLYCYYFKHA